MKNIAIIPARGGSKRLYKKNSRPFLGKPIIQYSIDAALESGLFSEVMVSTDDEEIAAIALKGGANVPFLRTSENSNDFATITDVISEVIRRYQLLQDVVYDNICCIFATAPFTTGKRLSEGYNLMLNKKYASVFPVCRFSYPIMRALKKDESTGAVSMIWPEYLTTRTQDIPDAFHDCGQFYWINTAQFYEYKALFTPNSGILELTPFEFQDIDNEDDWKMAEIKFQLFKEINILKR